MIDNLYVAGFCFIVSAAAAGAAYLISKKTYEATAIKAAELSGRIESARAESAAIIQSIQLAKCGLEKKITRNAMQSITKQAKDLTSAVIEGS